MTEVQKGFLGREFRLSARSSANLSPTRLAGGETYVLRRQ